MKIAETILKKTDSTNKIIKGNNIYPAGFLKKKKKR